MAIGTLTELKAEIASYLNRDDLTTAIPTFISLAEDAFNRDIRHRKMIKRAQATLTAGDSYLALPSDFLEAIAFTIQASPNVLLSLRTIEQLASDNPNNTTGKPTGFALVGDEIKFAPIPDAAYTIELVYYASFARLGDADPSNWLLANHADAYLFGALVQASPYLLDDARIPVWGSLLTRSIQGINGENDRGAYSGGPQRIQIDMNVV